LVFVGLAYTVVAYCQLGRINRQTRTLIRATRAQHLAAGAAKRAAIAAEDSNKQARQAMETELRAYLSIMRIVILSPTLDDPLYKARPGVLDDVVQVFVKNSGKTPAYNTRTTANTCIVPARNTLPDDFAYADFPSSVTDYLVAAQTVAAEGETSFSCASVPSPELMRSVRNGENWLYAYGHVDYADVFKNPHQTPFCWLFVQGKTPTEYIVTTYKDHNSPD
jgi:hypothetical protein